MKNIRTTTTKATAEKGSTKLFCTKDVCKAIGVGWHSLVISKVPADQKGYAGIVVQKKVKGRPYKAVQKHSVLSEEGVATLCKERGKDNPLIMTKLEAKEGTDLEKRLGKLETVVQELKKVAASDIVLEGTVPEIKAKIKSPVASKNGDEVIALALANASARKEVNEICSARANELIAAQNVSDQKDKQFYHNLVFTSLYAEFKKNHENSVDLVAEASILAKARNTKISALLAAEINGHAVALRDLAKTLFVKAEK